MRTKVFKTTDLAVLCALIALIVFGHAAMSGRTAHAAPSASLLMQGAGVSYELQINEHATDLEYNARDTLAMLGSAQMAYAANTSSGKYAEIDQLLRAGYLQPNQSGRTMVSGYSISFYLPGGRRGFSLIAESHDFSLRSFLISENQEVILLTPSVLGDPNSSWETVRAMESELQYTEGRFDFLHGLQLLNYDPPLQVRLNAERTQYLLCSFKTDENDLFDIDDSIIYMSSLRSYMIGDTREVIVYE